jgi:hypothetical protein
MLCSLPLQAENELPFCQITSLTQLTEAEAIEWNGTQKRRELLHKRLANGDA